MYTLHNISTNYNQICKQQWFYSKYVFDYKNGNVKFAQAQSEKIYTRPST